MQTFRTLFHKMTGCEQFKALYQQECNVCVHTLRIFERMLIRGIGMEQLAAELKVDITELQGLKDADGCDPNLVSALCRYFDLDMPEACPKRQSIG